MTEAFIKNVSFGIKEMGDHFMEKNGTITLTEDDLKEYNSGKVSQRIVDNWNLTLEELKEIIDNKSYKLL